MTPKARVVCSPIISNTNFARSIRGCGSVSAANTSWKICSSFSSRPIEKLKSPEMASKVVKYFDTEIRPENAWKVESDSNGDNHAPLGKRIQLWFYHIIPKSVL